MEYTVKALADLSGVTARTIRHYDEINLLKPCRTNSSGYRIYGEKEVDLLQQILFFRELGVELEEIKGIIYDDSYDEKNVLEGHLKKLLLKKDQLEKLILSVEKTINYKQGGIKMSNEEKFEGFKQKMVKENEEKYGQEIRAKYGDKKIDKSNQKLMNMTKAEYEALERLGNDLIKAFMEGFKLNDPACEKAQEGARLHAEWLSSHWDQYSKEAHMGVTQMYVDDERFRAYYDQHQEGLAEFIRDAVHIYCQG